MKLEIANTWIDISFTFGNRSSQLGYDVMQLVNQNKPFVLYSDDNCFEIFIPEILVSINQDKETVRYKSVDAFNARLAMCVMVFDYVKSFEIKQKLSMYDVHILTL